MNKKVILVGAGCSITEGIEQGLWSKIKESSIEIWSLNSAFLTMPYLPSKQLWVDYGFFKHQIAKLQEIQQKGVEMICKRHPKYGFLGRAITQYDGCKQREFYKTKMKEVSHMFIGLHGLVGTFALSVAVVRGYDLIYLLGYDWGNDSIDNFKTHYYQDKIKNLNIKSLGAGKPNIYLEANDKPNKHIKDFDIYKKEDCEIINVSPNSNLYQFPKIDYPEFFRRINNEKN